MIICKEIRIHLEHEIDSDGYHYATMACFDGTSESTCTFARCIDSFRTQGSIKFDFERDDIRMWASGGKSLKVDNSYGPTITAI